MLDEVQGAKPCCHKTLETVLPSRPPVRPHHRKSEILNKKKRAWGNLSKKGIDRMCGVLEYRYHINLHYAPLFYNYYIYQKFDLDKNLV